jgi:hypothetical protein
MHPLSSQRKWRKIAGPLIVLLLLAQFAVASFACDMSGLRAPVVSEQALPCHESEEPGTGTLCIAHCTAGDQGTHFQAQVDFSIPALVVFRVNIPTPARKPVSAIGTPTFVPGGDPPIAIRFQVFRT